jgi:hypothetical protein
MVTAAWNPSTLKLMAGSSGKICTNCCQESWPKCYKRIDHNPGEICVSPPKKVTVCISGVTACLGGPSINGTYELSLEFDDICSWNLVVAGVIQLRFSYCYELSPSLVNVWYWNGYDWASAIIVGYTIPACTYCLEADPDGTYRWPISCSGYNYAGGHLSVRPGSYDAWGIGVLYPVGKTVTHDGVFYECLADHTSQSTDEPGVGVNWPMVWKVSVC